MCPGPPGEAVIKYINTSMFILQQLMYDDNCRYTVQHKTWVGQNFGRLGTERKWVETILAANHTNNSSLVELATLGG